MRPRRATALVWRSDYTRVPLKPISVLTPDGCVDTGCEKGQVLGDLEEGIRGERDEEQQTKNPIHGL